jgi:hypothetical protein
MPLASRERVEGKKNKFFVKKRSGGQKKAQWEDLIPLASRERVEGKKTNFL